MTELLWVNKNADSKILSRGDLQESVRIRKHIRLGMKKTGSATLVMSSTKIVSSSHGRTTAPSLRPNVELSLNRKRADKSTRKKQLNEAASTSLVRTNQKYTSISIESPLQYIWPDMNQNERLSLHFFAERTSKDWTGWQDAEFWSRLALPMAQTSTTIARSLIALASFHESTLAGTCLRRKQLQLMSESKGLVAVTSLAAAQLSHFEALVSCIIIMCFENIRGYREHSHRLLQSGLGLLANSQGRLSAAEAEIAERCLRPLYQRLRHKICSMADPATCLKVALAKRRQSKDSQILLPVVPAVFSSLAEARESLLDILRNGEERLTFNANRGTVVEQNVIVGRLWEVALLSMPLPSDNVERNVAQISMNLLRASRLFGHILLATAESEQETDYDQYLPEFHVMMDLVREALDCRSNLDMSFGIDNGLIEMMVFVVTKCRCPQLRRSAMYTLSISQRREGDRAVAASVVILEQLLQLEGDGQHGVLDFGIPETSRYRLLRGEEYLHDARLDVIWIRSPYDPDKGAEIERKALPLSPSPREYLQTSRRLDVPNAVFGAGYAEFMDRQEPASLLRFDVEEFIWPIPRT